MRLLPLVKFGLLIGFSGMTIGCVGLSSSSGASSTSASNRGASPTPSASAQPAANSAAAAPAESSSEAAIWSELQQGSGYVIMMRHALAPGTGDPPGFVLEDCSTQRNLSPAGRQQAKTIGLAFRQQNVPVSQVLSSQWCRCLETARLLELGPVQPLPALNSFFSDRSTAAQQTEQVREFIRQQQNQPGVTILVTHQVNITAISNIVPASGEFVVLRSSSTNGSNGAIEVLGRLSPIPVE